MTASSGARARFSALIPWTEKEPQKQRRHLEHAVRPLPTARPRRLTLPLPKNDNGYGARKLQTTDTQLQSLFFSMLPPEVRLSIYLHYFPRETISIEKDERLRYVNWKPQKWDFLPLLLTCRRV